MTAGPVARAVRAAGRRAGIPFLCIGHSAEPTECKISPGQPLSHSGNGREQATAAEQPAPGWLDRSQAATRSRGQARGPAHRSESLLDARDRVSQYERSDDRFWVGCELCAGTVADATWTNLVIRAVCPSVTRWCQVVVATRIWLRASAGGALLGVRPGARRVA